MRILVRACALAVAFGWLAAVPVIAAAPPGAGGGAQLLAQSGTGKIKHVFVIVQEGHSFDNYFGTYPGVVGLGAQTAVPANPANPAAGSVAAHHLTSVRTSPLDNSLRAAEGALNGGAMNGFAVAQQSLPGASQLAMGYYTGQQIPYYWDLARHFVLADQFFSSALGGSVANHQFLVAARSWTAPLPGAALPSVPTVFNSLDAAKVSWGYFVAQYRTHVAEGRQSSLEPQVPLLGLANIAGNPADMARIQDISRLYTDLARGGLPSVNYVVQPGATEHAPGSVSQGQVATVGLINAIMRSRYWSSSAIFLTWSDWGGWYDQVVPPQVNGVSEGFRVPLLIVSPFVRPGQVFSQPADFTSILKFIEGLYGLSPLTSRDQNATSLLGAFSLQAGPRAPTPVVMGQLPASVISHGATGLVFIAYTLPGVILLALVGLALWERGAGRAPLLRRRL